MGDAFKKVAVDSNLTQTIVKTVSVEGACWGGSGSAIQVMR